ncbi:MAG: ATP-binding protein [Synergistaceae bacterium]|jgi:hypothetical protein|nr:ATP-binding protein [Synergistaceae bacterium]
MYFSLEYVLTAIERLSAIHPFYGMTFLSCKRNQLPVGHSINFPMDKYTKEFMDEIHKLNPLSSHYYQPYVANDKEKYWVTYKYPSTGLQSINTQTFLDAFLHVKKGKTWGWSDNYIDILVSHLKKGQQLSIFDLSVWVFKYKDWQEDTDFHSIMRFFIDYFHITDDEKERLFSENVEGYPSSNPFRSQPATWEELSTKIKSPPDAVPNRGATLSYLKLDNVGPTSNMVLEPNTRLNIITGDNGLGKSFLMECVWWALTGTWPDIAATPRNVNVNKKASITYELASEKGTPSREVVKYDEKQGTWSKDVNAPSIPGLIVYARVDGSYAIWDPIQQYSSIDKRREYVFSRSEVWNGAGSIEGLMRDWIKWQSTPDKYPFDILVNVLKEMSPPDMGELKPGQPIRVLNDKREIPTIIHPYGEVPITTVSAGVRRIITLAYLIVWAWYEHKVGAELTKSNTENRMVILIDEIEAHLHPKWQRTILPAVLNIQAILSRKLGIQFIISTHSPLVLASIETRFNPEADKLFNIMANKDCGDVELAVVDFVKYGQINSWLTSPIFNLKQPRSQEAEETIDEAKKIQHQKNPSTVDVAHIHKMLLEELAETDPFWPRWLYFAEKNGVTI